jgi:hypothetical protein
VEPFFLRCETCQARLRVRDERFLGQVQSCPKCGSMVQILAPAGWLAAGETTPEPAPMEVAAASTPTILSRVVASMQSHAASWIAGTATALVACGLVGVYMIAGDEDVATQVAKPAVVAMPIMASPIVEHAEADAAPSEPLPEPIVQPELATIEPADGELETTLAEPVVAEVVVIEQPAPSSEPTTAAATVVEPDAVVEKPRTLTLEPVQDKEAPIATSNTATETSDYPPAVEVEPAASDTKPAATAPARITNFKDQLALPIDAIDLPAMRIGEFVNLMSTMTAVPIKLNPKVLGDVGMSSRSMVNVRDENTTAGQLLARVLKEHQLTCIERDGALNVVRAKR